MRTTFVILGFTLLFATAIFAQTGEISGVVTDALTQEPLIGVNVVIKDTKLGAATDAQGRYVIPKLNVGGYTLVFSMIGYEPRIITDVIVKSRKTAYVSTELRAQVLASEQEVVVTASSYFTKPSEAPVSSRNLNYEEVRRSPGAREDISRMIQNLPGVTPTTDDRNDLVIRGGSPSEVLFLIDNIEIPNPNHFGTQGATGGPISMINNEFLESVNFMAGGFSARYGNKLSGVLDLKFREGNHQNFDGKFDLNFGGAGGIFEGGMAHGKGAWLAAFHRSYLEFMESALGIGGVPIYSNMQSKLDYQLSNHTKLSVLGLGGDDRIEINLKPDWEDYAAGEIDTTDLDHIINKTRQFAVGANVQTLWSSRVFSNFTLSHAFNRFYIDTNRRTHRVERVKDAEEVEVRLLPNGHLDVYDNTSIEQATDFKTDWTWLVSHQDELSFGGQLKLMQFEHDIVFQPFDSLNVVGTPAEKHAVSTQQSLTPKLGTYANYLKRFTPRLQANLGVRYDYFKLLGTHDFSPRASLRYEVNERLSLNAAAGIFHQSPELVYITGDASNRKNLGSIRSDHFVAGLDYLLSEATLFSVEFFRKNYFDYPVSNAPDFAFYSTANSGSSYGAVGSEALVSKGEGHATGFEVLVQKKMVAGLYGLASYSHAKIEHKALDGIWRSGEFDNRNVLNLVLGYRLNKSYEFSAKWRYAGGRPYTPFDEAASRAASYGILDVTNINSARFAPYHRLDLRYDYRKYFKRLTLVTYLSIENVYSRENHGFVFWNRKLQKPKFSYQTGFFPIGGVSVEF